MRNYNKDILNFDELENFSFCSHFCRPLHELIIVFLGKLLRQIDVVKTLRALRCNFHSARAIR